MQCSRTCFSRHQVAHHRRWSHKPLSLSQSRRPLRDYELQSRRRWRDSLCANTWVKHLMWPFETLLWWKRVFFLDPNTGENYLCKEPAVFELPTLKTEIFFFRLCFLPPFTLVCRYSNIPALVELLTVLFRDLNKFVPPVFFFLGGGVLFFSTHSMCARVCDADRRLETTPRPHALPTG